MQAFEFSKTAFVSIALIVLWGCYSLAAVDTSFDPEAPYFSPKGPGCSQKKDLTALNRRCCDKSIYVSDLLLRRACEIYSADLKGSKHLFEETPQAPETLFSEAEKKRFMLDDKSLNAKKLSVKQILDELSRDEMYSFSD